MHEEVTMILTDWYNSLTKSRRKYMPDSTLYSILQEKKMGLPSTYQLREAVLESMEEVSIVLSIHCGWEFRFWVLAVWVTFSELLGIPYQYSWSGRTQASSSKEASPSIAIPCAEYFAGVLNAPTTSKGA